MDKQKILQKVFIVIDRISVFKIYGLNYQICRKAPSFGSGNIRLQKN